MELEEGLYDLHGNEIHVGMNIGFLVVEVNWIYFVIPYSERCGLCTGAFINFCENDNV